MAKSIGTEKNWPLKRDSLKPDFPLYIENAVYAENFPTGLFTFAQK